MHGLIRYGRYNEIAVLLSSVSLIEHKEWIRAPCVCPLWVGSPLHMGDRAIGGAVFFHLGLSQAESGPVCTYNSRDTTVYLVPFYKCSPNISYGPRMDLRGQGARQAKLVELFLTSIPTVRTFCWLCQASLSRHCLTLSGLCKLI